MGYLGRVRIGESDGQVGLGDLLVLFDYLDVLGNRNRGVSFPGRELFEYVFGTPMNRIKTIRYVHLPWLIGENTRQPVILFGLKTLEVLGELVEAGVEVLLSAH